MIEYIHGQLTELTPALAVVEAAGVGYALNISLNTYTAIQGKKEVKLLVHESLQTGGRDDNFTLYGFATRQERELYRMLIKAHLTDTYFGVILPYLVPPFMIFFFRQYVLSLPRELLEAARIDGCTDYGVFFRIMVPNMIPAFGAMTILSCMNSWNNLLWPLIVLNSNEKFTIPIGMGTTITPYGNAFDVLMPGAVMAVVPIIIVYLFAQKTFIAGLTSGSVKG